MKLGSRFAAACAVGCAAALAWADGARAQPQPGSTERGGEIRIGKDSAADRVVETVYQARFAFVRIEQSEPGAGPNQHPFVIEPARLRALLEHVRTGKSERLLADADLDEIVPPLATALAKAGAQQDVSFAVSGRHGYFGPLAAREVTTARVFRRDDRLNVIFGLVRTNFESQFRATGYLMPFEPGQRAKQVDPSAKIAVDASAGSTRRPDWIVLSPEAIRTAQPAPNVPSAAAPTQPAAVPPAVAPPAGAAPAAGAAAAAAPAASPPAPPNADAIYRDASERLKALQKLRDTGVITEDEYREKRRQILDKL
jgi:hypothetical protein